MDLVEIRRPFNWGILLIADVNSDELPELEPNGGISCTSTAVLVPVRHAHDNDIEVVDEDGYVVASSVGVICHQVEGGANDAAFHTTINVPSGQLSIGDAEDTAILDLKPGPWDLHISVKPVEHPEHVTIELVQSIDTA